VNWYAHAVLAEIRSREPACLLGAMLPDLAAAAGLRAAPPREGPLALGFRLHLAADAAFHVDPDFTALVRAGREALEHEGLARGRARAAAHVGVELVLDGWLAGRRDPSTAFRAALALAGELADDATLFRPAPRPERWRSLLAALAEHQLPAAYARPERAARGVERALARRPRLALGPGEEEVVARWLARAQPAVEARGPALLVRSGAAAPRPF
jgi:hypothetical protein